MSLFKGCSKVQIRWIHKYLFLLKKLTSENESEKLAAITQEHLKIASKNLKIKKKALKLIEKNRSGKVFDENDLRFIELIQEIPDHTPNEFFIIKSEDRFEDVIDQEFTSEICDDLTLVRNRIKDALDLVGKISTKWKSNMSNVLETVSGVCDERNVINSGFTKDFPGFISLNINADASVIGEQIAHETTHLIFDNLLYFNSRAKDKLRNIPPIYSIFAQKPRSAELVLHGLFSYTSVYIYWDGLEIILPQEKSSIRIRKKQVLKYIQASILDLNNVLTKKDWDLIIKLYKTICPLFSAELWTFEAKINSLSNNIIRELKNYLNDIELAELILAIEGNKVSRISKPITDIKGLIKIINKLPVFYCFSSYLFSSKFDNSINDFQNVITSIYNLDSHNEERLDIHFYFSKNQKNLLNAHKLDQQDKCAPLFKTPKCCESHFIIFWEYALKELGGDLTKLYFTDSDKKFEITNLIYNPIGMYFGLGFCWHFPCSLNCKSTQKVVNTRIKVLMNYPYVFKKLIRINNYKLKVDLERNYHLIKK
jgi:hypothetical protein